MNHRPPLTLLAAPLLAGAAGAQSLVAHWKLDETSGSVLEDSSGNGYHADLVGGYSFGHPSAGSACGASTEFVHASQTQATFPTDSVLVNLVADVSVAAWVEITSFPGAVGRIFGNDNNGWSCGYMTDRLRFTTRFIQDYNSPIVPIPTGQWMHMVFVFDATYNVTFYVDGQLIGTVTGAAPANNGANLWIIGNLDSTGGISEYIDAHLDDLQVYDGSLTQEQVTFLYQNPCAAVSPPIGTGYCLSTTNSTGLSATIRATGSGSVGLNDLTLFAENVPDQPGVFFYGPGQSQVPFGNGFRCVDGVLGRLAVVMPTANVLTYSFDMAQPANQWTTVAPGSTWFFQAWYGDPVAGGAGFNLSDAVEIPFTP